MYWRERLDVVGVRERVPALWLGLLGLHHSRPSSVVVIHNVEGTFCVLLDVWPNAWSLLTEYMVVVEDVELELNQD